jgi:hypothetical protein
LNRELIALIATVFSITTLGLVAIVAIVILRPNAENGEIVKGIVTLIGPTVLLFVTAYKGIQNGTDIQKVIEATNGATEHQVKQAAAVATLTEQVASAKAAAEVAAKTAADAAIALRVKEL